MKKNFLNSVCPFRVLEQRVSWGEFISLSINGAFGCLAFFVFYIAFIAVAEAVGVVQ